MKLERSTYQKPLSLTGLGGGATSLNFAGAAGISKEYWIATLGSNTAGGGQDTRTEAKDVAVDRSGNVYVCGYTRCTPTGNYGILVVKYSESGSLEWQRIWGSTVSNSYDFGHGITVDGSGNIYVVGHSDSGGTNQGALILKYNDSGVLQWQRTFGPNSAEAFAVDFDNSGNIYICGTTSDGGNGNNHMIAKCNSSGTLQWQRALSSGTQSDAALDIAVDRNNDVLYISGKKRTPNYNYDGTLAKYNLSGVLQWHREFTASNGDYQDFANAIAVDSSGNVYSSGRTLQLASSNPGGQGYSNYDGFIVKCSSSGYSFSEITFGGNSSDDGTGLVFDSQDNLYLCGNSSSGNSVYSVGGRGLIMRFTTGLYSSWQRRLGDSGSNDGTQRITVDHQDVAIYTSGTTTDTGPGSYNMLISKLPPDGTGTGNYNTPHLHYVAETYTPTSFWSVNYDYSPGYSDSDVGTSQSTPTVSDFAGSLTSAMYVVS